MVKFISRLIFVIFTSLIMVNIALSAPPNFVGTGIVESITISSPNNEDLTIKAIGWVGAENPAAKITTLIVELDNMLVYKGNFKQIARPDISMTTGRKYWSNSGWMLNANVPTSVENGEYDIHIRAMTDAGDFIDIAMGNKKLQKIIIKRKYESNLKKKLVGVISILFIPLFYFSFIHSKWLSNKISGYFGFTVTPSTITFGLVGILFVFLVSAGITGSSVKLLYDQAPFLKVKTERIAFTNKSIRSDEWLVVTPLAIGQMNATPPFPIVNPNLGIEGHNMLVVGMAGVPVKHITQLAKPSTWGFYIFDLKRALAWYWWFPIFACLLALWGVLNLMIPGQWRLSFFLSLIFCLSPYTIAWSSWPAYAVFFPSLATWAAIHLLRQPCWRKSMALGILLGLSMAGFVLLLYPPWQVSLGYLYLVIAIGLVCRDHRYMYFNTAKVATLLLSVFIFIAILWSWWGDAKLAIEAMQNTVYPGQRTSVGGGESIQHILRGFTNIGSLYKQNGGNSNQSEIASFYYFFIPLLVAIVFRIKESRESVYLILLIVFFVAFSLIYIMHGIPSIVAEFTQWGRVPSPRVDLALGLSQIFLYGLVLGGDSSFESSSEKKILFACMISLLWVILIIYVFYVLPRGLFAGITYGVALVIILTAFLAGFWLILRNTKKFIALNLAMCASTTLAFNPLSFAINKIEISKDIQMNLNNPEGSAQKKKRALVLQSQIPTMALMSAGIPTVNGVLYYPQLSLWQNLGLKDSLNDVINRYQHLIFVTGKVEADDGFLIHSPQADVVKVTVDPIRFNFQLTGAKQLTAPDKVSEKLKHNPSLFFNNSLDGWSWFTVIPNCNSSNNNQS